MHFRKFYWLQLARTLKLTPSGLPWAFDPAAPWPSYMFSALAAAIASVTSVAARAGPLLAPNPA